MFTQQRIRNVCCDQKTYDTSGTKVISLLSRFLCAKV